MLELVPIVIPQIDWKTYLSVAQMILGESVSTDFDSARLPVGSRAFVTSVNTLSETLPALDIDSPALRHLHYTFLLATIEGAYLALMETTKLDFTSSQSARPGVRVAIVSGTLQEWKNAVVACSHSPNQDVKAFGIKAKQYFDIADLGNMWTHYLRITQPDRSLKLVHKP